MFGTLKPHGCRLGRAELADHQRFTCGLCSGLGARFGLLSRALVSNDAVFIGLLADAFQSDGVGCAQRRCPLLPVVRRSVAQPDGTALRFASAIQMLLADQWLADRAIEGRLLARCVRPLARRRVGAAQIELEALGLALDPVTDFEAKQAACEARPDVGPAVAAEPTAAALEHVFAQIAQLPGTSAAVRAPDARRELRALGRAVGGAIYWADALDDLERDYLAGEFNPCIVRRPRGWNAGALRQPRGRRRAGALPTISPARVRRCAKLLDEALAQVARSLAALPLVRHRALLTNILCQRFPVMARRLASRAVATASPASRQRLSDWLAMPWYGRFAARAMLAGAMVVVWLGGIRALWAKPAPPPPAGSTAPVADADAGPDAGDDGGASGGTFGGSPRGEGRQFGSASGSAPGPAMTAAPGESGGGKPTGDKSSGDKSSGDESSGDESADAPTKGGGTGSGWPSWSSPFDCCKPEKCCDCQGCMDSCCTRCCKQPCGDICGGCNCCDVCKGGNCGNGCCCK